MPSHVVGASVRGRSVRSLVSIDRKFRGSQLASDGKRERERALIAVAYDKGNHAGTG